jgi:general secretion pathway protein G
LLATSNQQLATASGFTLIELLLVMVIIAILAAIVLPKLTGRREQANQAAARQQISNFKSELETFEVDNGRYPTTQEGLQALATNPGNLTDWKKLSDTIPNDPWGRAYVYRCPGTNGNDYDLFSTGASGQEGGPDNIK